MRQRNLTRVLICHFAHLRLYLQPSSMREPRMFTPHSHCSYCGHPFEIDQAWPRLCAACGHTSFINPVPVSVVILPVDDGVLVVRRNIPPQIGQLALPGGYINRGESWQQAGARELAEETGIIIQPADLCEFRVKSAPGGTTLLVFDAHGSAAGIFCVACAAACAAHATQRVNSLADTGSRLKPT